MSFALSVLGLAVIVSVACALPGVFVVLRRGSMLVDGIGHAVLPGIVLGYLVTQDLDSPLLVVGAAVSGLVVVLGAQYLQRTGLLTGDAPQALVFPALFSVGVILVTLRFSDLHLDTHAVLVGDLNLAVLRPGYVALMLGVLAVNALFIAWLYPKLAVSTADAAFARSLGLRTGLLDAAFMLLVAVTVTAAFHATGAILVISLVVVAPATALLVSRRLGGTVALALAFAVAGSVGGFWAAYFLDAPTSAGMAVFHGLLFMLVLIWRRVRGTRQRGRADTRTASVAARPSGSGGPPSTRISMASE